MEGLLEGIGWTLLIVLALIGLAAGWIAGLIAGRNKGLYMVLGLVGAVAAPLILAALGLGALAAGGVLAVIIAALVGAAIVLAIGKMIFD